MRKYGFLIAVIAIVGVAVMLGAMSTVQASQPVPLFAPTPVSVNTRNADLNDVLSFYATKVVTADGNTGSVNIQNADVLDLQVTADQTLVAGAPNTTTLKLQFSNDGINWVDGATVLTANDADATSLQQYAVFGKLARINTDVTSANPLTLTVIAVSK